MASSIPARPLQKYQERTYQEECAYQEERTYQEECNYQERNELWAPPYPGGPFRRFANNIFRTLIEITAGGAIIGGIAIVANAGTDTMIAAGVATGLAGFTVLTSMSVSK